MNLHYSASGCRCLQDNNKDVNIEDQNWVVNCSGFNSYILDGKNDKKKFEPLVIIFMDKVAEEKVSSIKYEFTHWQCDIKIVFVPCTKRLFIPLLIPRESVLK